MGKYDWHDQLISLMDGFMRKTKAKVGNVSARLKVNGVDWSVITYLLQMTVCY